MSNLNERSQDQASDSLNTAYAAMAQAKAHGHLRPRWFILALAGIVSGLVMSLSFFQFELTVFLVLGLVLVIAMERRQAKVQVSLSKGELGAGLVFGLVLVGITALIVMGVEPQWRPLAIYVYGGLAFLTVLALGLRERQRHARTMTKAGVEAG